MGVLISEIQRLTNVDEEDQVANEGKQQYYATEIPRGLGHVRIQFFVQIF